MASAKWPDTICYRTCSGWLTLGEGLSATGRATTPARLLGLESARAFPICALRAIHLYQGAAIIAGSSHTYAELAPYREKLFFMPTEIGINPSLFEELPGSRPSRRGTLELIFVGRLIPLKGCDIALRGAAQLLRSGAAHFTVVGDGPQRESLQQLAKSLDIEGAVSFVGWLPHREDVRALSAVLT